MAVPTMSRCTMLRWSKCPRLHRDSLANLSLSHVSFLLLFVSKVNMVLNVHRNIRLIRDGGEGGRGYEGRGRLYRDTVTTTRTSALRWAAMRAILMFY